MSKCRLLLSMMKGKIDGRDLGKGVCVFLDLYLLFCPFFTSSISSPGGSSVDSRGT